MHHPARREFLQQIGTGMLTAGAGTLAADLGIPAAFADEEPKRLDFGPREPLVRLMQDIAPAKLQPLLVKKLQAEETTLADLISAAALANARTFGGEDYVGYHCEMALTPALEMARALPKERQALPVLKVIYRNTARLQERGPEKHEVLKPVQTVEPEGESVSGERLRDAVRQKDVQRAEQIFAVIGRRPVEQAYSDLQHTVLELPMVHRVVLAHRSWELAKLVGPDQAHTLLRQSLRYCLREEEGFRRDHPYLRIRTLVPRAIDQHRLQARKLGSRKPEDQWIEALADTIYRSSREQAVDVTAAARAEGMMPDAVAEAIILAATQLILRQDRCNERGPFTHGNSAGVHACDAMNAWRHIARECGPTHTIASLLVGAYFVAHESVYKQEPYPHAEHLKQVKGADADALLTELDDAIRNNDQARASAAAQRYGSLGFPERLIFDRLLGFTVSEDGRLHGEKYYRTAVEEFARARPAFRWRHVVSLARVTASAYGLNSKDEVGHRAPGYEEACRLLGVRG